jgi:hypothetical protein
MKYHTKAGGIDDGQQNRLLDTIRNPDIGDQLYSKGEQAMVQYRILPYFALLLLTIGHHTCSAQGDSSEGDVQSLIDELKNITAQARQQRAADRWLLNALDDLAAKYEWPWRRVLLDERFADGDFTANPAWQVVSGQYWIDASLGLRSRVGQVQQPETTSKDNAGDQDFGQVLLRGLLESMVEDQSSTQTPAQPAATHAQIFLPIEISNAFAIRISFSVHNMPSETGRFLTGVYQGANADSGYLLSLTTGAAPVLDVIRVRAGGSAIIESLPLNAQIQDGQTHQLEWRRNGDGQMELLLDANSISRTSDRAFSEPFQAINIFNMGGDYAVRSIAVFGSQ